MVSSEKKLANAMGGKTARACDSCIRKRARWYCAADDVFLCQFCDSLVHSANPLARCHQRVRLKIASMEIPTWHQGFTKKSRTPRGKNSNKYGSNRIPNSDETVPEIGSDELNAMNSDEKLPYQVPEFDPFSGELCFSGDFDDMMVPIQSDDYTKTPSDTKGDDESEVPFPFPFDLNSLILPSDLELAEFAADVESLLGKGLDEEYSLEMVDQCRINMDSERVKVEEEMMMMMSFDYDSAVVAWEEEDDDEKGKGMVVKSKSVVVDDNVNNIINYVDDKIIIKKMLKLDYEGIIAAWDDERSPWATGDRPELDCLLDCMHFECGDMGKVRLRLDGGREARVSRYREKRRRRLFSKKIRYQVRKLNAEKRPRIKGRFVKRPSFADTTTTASGFSLLST